MGNSEEGKSCKPEKSSSPAQEQANIHVYSDWAAMQAFYGPRVAVPPYFNSAVASGHPPHPYMWPPPQPMMPSYGVPYAAIYAHGGVYAHPGVPPTATPLSMDAPRKSSGNTDQGLMKKLKGFDGLAMSIGNGNPDDAELEADHGGPSQSGETEGSSSGSDGNTAGLVQNRKKRSHQESHSTAEAKTEGHRPISAVSSGPADNVMGAAIPSTTVGKVMGTVISPSMTTALELGNSPSTNVKSSPINVPQPCPVVPNETWLQNERELKRERRKQSNRESARRSRLRKHAETEELARKVESLTTENITLKSEITRLTEDSGKLKLENAKLMGKMKNVGPEGELMLNEINEKRGIPVNTEDLLARVSGSVDTRDDENGVYENKKSGAKLRQLLVASPRTDAVAAG